MANENPLNVRLCDILVDAGIDAETLVRHGKSETDIECRIGDHIVALEAEHGESNAKKAEAIKDADTKLSRKVCHAAIALVYPENYRTRRDLETGSVQAHVRVPGKQPKPAETTWTTLQVDSLADYVRQAPNELGSPEALAKKADAAVKRAAEKFTAQQARSIMAEMGPAAIGTNIKGLMTDLLTALMFHAKLDIIRHEQKPALDARANPPQPYAGPWPPASVTECRQSGQIAWKLHQAHDLWLAVDYKQILEWSCAIINALPNTTASNEAVDIIAEAALEIQRTTGNQHHDLVGITFCQSVETAKSDGSMYTTIPAATMLTALLFDGIPIDWTDYAQVTGLRIVDFACGTGTLLIAAANYILSREQTGRPAEVAQALLDQVLYGFDVNNRAIFQTATGIGMIAPSVAFHNMHLYSLTLGLAPEAGGPKAKLGSLEMLEGINQISLNPRPVTGTRIDTEPAPVEVEKFNIAIMNPPFTANKKRHNQFSKTVKDALTKREQELYAGTGIPQTSNSNGFFVMAEKHLDAEKGRMGFVVPTATATNASALATRRLLASRFHIKYLVVSYDPERIYQSGNTSIGEMLVVLERKHPGEQPPTRVVKLTTNPATASAAAACASSIIDGRTTEHGWGIVDHIDGEAIINGDWSAVQFTSNELHRIASTELWGRTLGNQVEVKTLGRRINENAQKCIESAVNATPALYDNNVAHCDRLEVPPDAYVQPQPGNTRAMKYLQQVNRLKLPTRVRLTTVKNMACRTTVPTVGAAWQNGVPQNCGVHNSLSVEKVIVMILNSTPGKLGMLLVRSNGVPSYPNYGIEGLHRIPMPWVRDLTPEQVGGLVEAYDELCGQERLSLPQAHRCPVQLAIDAAVCQHLDFDADLCERIRHLLAQEPMITGKRYEFPPQPPAQSATERYPLRGLVTPATFRYERPFDPAVPLEDWDALK